MSSGHYRFESALTRLHSITSSAALVYLSLDCMKNAWNRWWMACFMATMRPYWHMVRCEFNTNIRLFSYSLQLLHNLIFDWSHCRIVSDVDETNWWSITLTYVDAISVHKASLDNDGYFCRPVQGKPTPWALHIQLGATLTELFHMQCNTSSSKSRLWRLKPISKSECHILRCEFLQERSLLWKSVF